MENIFIKKVANGFVLEITSYDDDDKLYIFKTKEELLEAIPAHVQEAINMAEAKKAEKDAKKETDPAIAFEK